ncbi:MAG: hypothetical protein HC806_08900 [Anaerolineae bacterium]|nr:hypothetical protein [Anaerolineae bacterium]
MKKILLFLMAISFTGGFHPLSSAAPSLTSIFINELHYENTGTDTGEAIEIAGPVGTNLAGWSIVLYNGANSETYDTDALSGTIPDLCDGFGVITLNYPQDGLQNGSPDGIALVNSSSTVIQFLSYEGSFTAANGPANGMTSTDISVTESTSTPVGDSLQLTGTGTQYEDFTWASSSPETFGDCNTDQTFTGSGDTPPTINNTAPEDTETGIAVDFTISISFDEDVTVIGSWFTFICNVTGVHTATITGGPQDFTINPDVDFNPRETCTLTVDKNQVEDQDGTPDNMVADYTFAFSTGHWVINEIYSDPADGLSGDANGDGIRDASQDEFLEIVNYTGATVDISNWVISDETTARHIFPPDTLVPDSCPILIFGGGTPTGLFGNAIVHTASTGQLNLANSGDTVAMDNGILSQASYIYGVEGNNNVSLTRDPDITGSEPLVAHHTATGSGGTLFSPGKKSMGQTFQNVICPSTTFKKAEQPVLWLVWK